MCRTEATRTTFSAISSIKARSPFHRFRFLRGIPVIEIELERAMLVRIEETQEQAMKTTEPTMTESQRDEVKRLCHEADVPDKSGELLTEEGARHFIADLRKQIAARND